MSIEEPSGRRWLPILLSYDKSSHTTSTPSLLSLSSYQSDSKPVDEVMDHYTDPALDSMDVFQSSIPDSLQMDLSSLDMEQSGSSSKTLSPEHQAEFGACGDTSIIPVDMEKSSDSNKTLTPTTDILGNESTSQLTRQTSKESLSSNASSTVDFVWDYKEDVTDDVVTEPVEKPTEMPKFSVSSIAKIKNLQGAKNLLSQVKGIGKHVNKQVKDQVKGIINNVVMDESKSASSADLTTISFSKASRSSSTGGLKLEFTRKNSVDDRSDINSLDGRSLSIHGNPTKSGLVAEAVASRDTESQWSEDEEEDYRYRSLPDLSDIQWLWVSGMMCKVPDENSIRRWFSGSTSDGKLTPLMVLFYMYLFRTLNALTGRCKSCNSCVWSFSDGNHALKAMYHRSLSLGSWRTRILASLQQRNQAESNPFSYEKAINKASTYHTYSV